MSKLKLGIVAIAAVFVISAAASSAASAATNWMVNGTELTGTAALAATASVEERGKLEGGNVNIECNGSTLNGTEPVISATTNMGLAKSLTFTNCKSLVANCSLTSSTISTVPILVEVTLEGSTGSTADIATFAPETKNTFATFAFEGELCGISGTQGVTGKAKVLAPTGQVERTLQLIKSITTAASGELKIGSSGATLEGAALLQMANGQAWSFL